MIRIIVFLLFVSSLNSQCIEIREIDPPLTPPPGTEVFPSSMSVFNINEEQTLRHNNLATHIIEIDDLNTGDFMKFEIWIVDELNVRQQRIVNAYVTDEYSFTVLTENGPVSAATFVTSYDGKGPFGGVPGVGFNKQDFVRPLGYDYGAGSWNGSTWDSEAKRLEVVAGTQSVYINRMVELYHTEIGVEATQLTFQLESYETGGSVFGTGVPNDDFFPTDITGTPNEAGPFTLTINSGQFPNGQAAIRYATEIQNVMQTLSSTIEFNNEMTAVLNRPNTTEVRATFISFPTSGGDPQNVRMERVFAGRLESDFTDNTPRFGFVVRDAAAVDRTAGIIILNNGIANPLVRSNDIGSQFILQHANIPHTMTIGTRYAGVLRLLDVGSTLLYEQTYEYELNYAW